MKKKISANKNSMRPFSSILVDGPERAAALAMLYPVGFTEADFKKPIIGIASTWSNVTPCNMHIDKLALEVASADLKQRKQTWKKPAPRYARGVLAKYAAHVTSASQGAVTDADLKL